MILDESRNYGNIKIWSRS